MLFIRDDTAKLNYHSMFIFHDYCKLAIAAGLNMTDMSKIYSSFPTISLQESVGRKVNIDHHVYRQSSLKVSITNTYL